MILILETDEKNHVSLFSFKNMVHASLSLLIIVSANSSSCKVSAFNGNAKFNAVAEFFLTLQAK